MLWTTTSNSKGNVCWVCWELWMCCWERSSCSTLERTLTTCVLLRGPVSVPNSLFLRSISFKLENWANILIYVEIRCFSKLNYFLSSSVNFCITILAWNIFDQRVLKVPDKKFFSRYVQIWTVTFRTRQVSEKPGRSWTKTEEIGSLPPIGQVHILEPSAKNSGRRWEIVYLLISTSR